MEQLFLIKNGGRVALDLGGANIAIQLQNPLAASLENIELSRSWSFTLPSTTANKAAFDFAGVTPRAVRATEPDGRGGEVLVTADEYPAEYLIDGVPVLPDCTLHLDSVKAGGYVCQLVDRSQRALALIKEENRNIREIVGDVWVPNPKRNYLGEDARIVQTFDNERPNNTILYNAGVQCIGSTVNVNYVFYNRYKRGSEDNAWEGTLTPPPCVPLRWLLLRVCQLYGLTLGIGQHVTRQTSRDDSDIFSYGVVPCVNTEVTQEQGAAVWYLDQENRSGDFMGQIVGQGLLANMPVDVVNVAVSVDVIVPEELGLHDITIHFKGKQVGSLSVTNRSQYYTSVGWQFKGLVDLGRDTGGSLDIKFKYDGKSNVNLGTWQYESKVKIFAYVPSGRNGSDINLATCLPSVGAWDLLKTACSIMGGVPYVDGGVLKLLRYTDISATPKDYSAKYSRLNSHDITRAASWVAQRNYWLMNTEKVGEANAEYQQRQVHADAADTTLADKKEVFKSAFASEYIQQPDARYLDTGRTIAFYKEEGGWVSVSEAKPTIGYVGTMPYRYRNLPGMSGLSPAWWYRVATFEQSAEWLAVVEKCITRSEGLFKVQLTMSAIDLAQFDPLTPFYIEQLAMRGLVVSVRYCAAKRFAEVQLLKY